MLQNRKEQTLSFHVLMYCQNPWRPEPITLIIQWKDAGLVLHYFTINQVQRSKVVGFLACNYLVFVWLCCCSLLDLGAQYCSLCLVLGVCVLVFDKGSCTLNIVKSAKPFFSSILESTHFDVVIWIVIVHFDLFLTLPNYQYRTYFKDFWWHWS